MTRPLLVAACLIAALATLAGLWALATAHPLAPNEGTDYDMEGVS